jgi:nucleoside-diphosphate-sugar epimerase
MTSDNTALILGATGGIGGEVARQLRDRGWAIRALKRSASEAISERDGITWIRGDAMNAEDVRGAAEGCSVVVHAVNPPGYRRWSELVLPMLDNTIAAAGAVGATIVLPGTVYNFGPDAFPLMSEDSAQHPLTRKGAIRVGMERRLREASEGGTQVLIVRAGDFFGAAAKNSWFSLGLVKPDKRVAAVSIPNSPGVGHNWSYLPDVARTMVALLARRESLKPFSTFHMAGHWDADGTEMAAAIQRVVQRHAGSKPRIDAFPWWLIRLASPFVTTFREMLEMRYLWQVPVNLDNTRLIAELGQEPHTPLDEAIEATLSGLGCVTP